MRRLALLASWLVLLTQSVVAQEASSPKEEFRGAWIATVINLDWPSAPGLPVATQKSELLQILDRMQRVGLNAALFQVRPEADALYASEIEPWSYWLTGEQGVAPAGGFDPLSYAVEEAHKRGLELHAWLNPYRASRGNTYTKASNHVTNTNPEWLLEFNGGNSPIVIFDPGLQASRDRVARVVADIARRYEIDGIHFDDYFYPYPPNTISNEDQATFAADPRGFSNIGDWRRDNIDLMVAQVQDSLLAIRPEAKFGISPFGIWKDRVPSTVRGLDAYNVIYSDPLAWLDAETIDYVTPQLYWSSQRAFDTDDDGIPDAFNNQRFTTLAAWWGGQRNGRHLYPGIAPYRVSQVGYGPAEIPTQIRYTRRLDSAQGTVMFRVNAGVLKFDQGLSDSLKTDLYRQPALTPSMAWKSQDAPGTPSDLVATRVTSGEVSLAWSAPPSGDAETRFYAVYRIPQASAGDIASATADGRYLARVTGDTQVTDYPTTDGDFTYVVTAVSANSIESSASGVASVQNIVSTRPEAVELAITLEPVRPNPFRSQTEVAFTVREPGVVTLRIVDMLGREVARLLDRSPQPAGRQLVRWSPDASLPAGAYLVVLETDGDRATRSAVVVR